MPVGGLDSYFMRWSRPEASAGSIEEALVELMREWYRAASLSSHHVPGNLVITLQIGGQAVTFEITDEAVLRDYMGNRRPVAILDYLSDKMGIPPDQAMSILEDVDRADVRVDALFVPDSEYRWRSGVDPSTGFGAPPPEEELPKAALGFVGDRLSEEDQTMRRGRGRRRSARGEDLLRQLVVIAREQGLSDAEAARRSGVPRTTIRDTRYRLEREDRARVQIGLRSPGQQYTEEQRSQIVQAVRESGGNASQAARRLGLPPRTVREIRQRHREAMASPESHEAPAPSRSRYTAGQKSGLIDRMRDLMSSEGLSATAAGRRIGVKPRTARGWVQQERERDLE
jgi:transposase-like protein